MPFKSLIVDTVGDDLDREATVHFEPLRALPPLFGPDERVHSAVVAATATGAWVIIGADEGLGRVGKVGVDG